MYLGIDIGGTKTLVATLNNDGVIQQRIKFPTAKNYKLFIRKLADTVAYLSTNKFIATGVGMPGRIDRKQGIGIAMGNLPWRNVPIRSDLEKISRAPTIVENDAKLAGLSEAMLLKNEFNKVLYVTISTGIGVAIIIDKKIDQVFQDSEGGKMILEHNGKMQEWEDFASGKAITRRFGQHASEITQAKDWKEIAENLAAGLIPLIATIQPEVVVLGGGVSTHFTHFYKPLVAELKKYATPLVPVPPIKQAQRPEDAVLYGCYDLAKDFHESNIKKA